MIDLVVRGCSPELGIDGGVVVEHNPSLGRACRETLDVGACQVMPGLVDPHVHFNEPGREAWEGIETGSLAGSAGGVTTWLDMPLNSTPVISVAAFEAKRARAEAKSRTDFGLWGGLTPESVGEVERLADCGVVGFKAFMCPTGIDDFRMADVATLRAGMKRIAKTGRRLALHAEWEAALRPGGDWFASRPPEAEVRAIEIAGELAGETGCPIIIVHVSCPAGLDAVARLRDVGVDVKCETCPHYLVLNRESALAIGTRAKCAPPVRDEAERLAMVERVAAGEVDWIGSDHSPCLPEMKTDDWKTAWGGISGVQHGLGVLAREMMLGGIGLGQGNGGGGIGFGELVRLMSRGPAEAFGLSSKGGLEIGQDADFFLWAFEDGFIRREELLDRHRQSAFVGMRVGGVVRETWVRGRCVFRGGEAMVEPGWGETVKNFREDGVEK